VTTVALPLGIYATQRLSAADAYAVTKAVWEAQAALAKRNPAWQMVAPQDLAALGVKLHKGALRYYDEAKIAVPAALR
jgi:TRAP-type uncharacterized transport system substrate-binding protein